MSKKNKKNKKAEIATPAISIAETVAPPAPQNVPPPAPEVDIWTKNIAQFEKHWDIWTKEAKAQGEPIMVREAYRTTNGAVYFEYVDIGRLPVIRSLEINKALLKLKFAVTEEYIQKLEKEVQAAVAAEDHTRVLALNKEFFDRNKLAPEIPTMLELAAFFFIRHDENPYIFNPIIHGQKVRAAQTDFHLQSFFLDACWQILNQTAKPYLQLWKIGSEAAFQDYLQGKRPTRKAN